MLLDEPFAGIDPIAVGDIQSLVRHLTNRGIGVLITDHNVRETLGLTDRAYIIYSGDVLSGGRADEIVGHNPRCARLPRRGIPALTLRLLFPVIGREGGDSAAGLRSERYKQETPDQFSLAFDGAHPTTPDPGRAPGAGDDAAADAGDQAAAALQSRSGRLCRGRTRAQSAARRSAEDERPADKPGDATAAPDEPSARGEAWNEGEGPSNGHAIDERLDISAEDVFPDDAAPSRPRTSELPAGYSEWAAVGTGGRDDGDYNLEAFVSAETTLADWLREQLALAVADPARRMIGFYLIDLVDEAGYLGGDLAAVAEKLGTTITEVETVLGIVQGFDPPGIAARDLAECLALQLKERDRFDPAMEAWSRGSISWPGAISPSSRKSAASAMRISPT